MLDKGPGIAEGIKSLLPRPYKFLPGITLHSISGSLKAKKEASPDPLFSPNESAARPQKQSGQIGGGKGLSGVLFLAFLLRQEFLFFSHGKEKRQRKLKTALIRASF